MAESTQFETLLASLESVVKKLEDKSISLEEAVLNYQKGLELSKECTRLLENAEKVVLETVK